MRSLEPACSRILKHCFLEDAFGRYTVKKARERDPERSPTGHNEGSEQQALRGKQHSIQNIISKYTDARRSKHST